MKLTNALVASLGALVVSACVSSAPSPTVRTGPGVNGQILSSGARPGETPRPPTGPSYSAVASDGLAPGRVGAGLADGDRRQAAEAEYRALEFGRSGSPVAWQNPESGHYGEVVPGEPKQVGGRNCRDYKHVVYVNGQPDTVEGTACRTADGIWQPA